MRAGLLKSERRVATRHLACCPAALVRPDGAHRSSFVHDLSESGLLLLVHTTKVGLGDCVQLRLYLAEDTLTYRRTSGRVVRAESLKDSSPWLRRVAVSLDAPLAFALEEIESFRRRAVRLGLAS